MPVFDPEPRKIRVLGDHTTGGKFLFEFNPKTMEIEIRNRGATYVVKLNDLLAFANETDQDIFHVKASVDEM
jgi:hypothetical protein